MSTERLRALIVEDEWPAREYLVELFEDSKLVDVVGAVSNLDEARQALHDTARLGIDVAFIDVRLAGEGDQGGLDLVRSFSGRANAPMFVLATAFRDHAIEAFSLDIVDYLVKPFTEERVEQCLRRLLARRRASVPAHSGRIVARRGKTLVFLEPDEVWAFEAAERLTSVHTPHGVFDVDLSLAAIELSFGRSLLRVHRNWLVNAAHIKELDREGRETRIFVGSCIGPEQRGVRIPVGRERAQAVRDMLLASATGVRRGQ
ncbi:LytTR family DNA-binding domain-containing protein [Pendulispora rubella]|uniref:LytTR family DNA-binding domain-containing protein n=1 Tax=Pendulispora rubella TaxID=2741070 RepID=A0ABZ2LJB2_9BACT